MMSKPNDLKQRLKDPKTRKDLCFMSKPNDLKQRLKDPKTRKDLFHCFHNCTIIKIKIDLKKKKQKREVSRPLNK
ncbi:hypothetical protein, partial [Photobacterium alginatilyticum]|uniref:hypothetical protein n=1 Tax=Photobacterium alginatilyticum TaxID=1775171 RepID=UPI00196642FF